MRIINVKHQKETILEGTLYTNIRTGETLSKDNLPFDDDNWVQNYSITDIVNTVNHLGQDKLDTIPREFFCPLTYNLIVEPYFAPDGRIYEYGVVA